MSVLPAGRYDHCRSGSGDPTRGPWSSGELACLTFGYDADGNKVSFADSDVAQTTVTYDNANRVLSVAGPIANTTYQYYLAGR